MFALLKETSPYTGRPWGEAVSAWSRAVSAWQPVELEAALDALLAADYALKESRLSSDEQILASLVLTLCGVPVERQPERQRRTMRGIKVCWSRVSNRRSHVRDHLRHCQRGEGAGPVTATESVFVRAHNTWLLQVRTPPAERSWIRCCAYNERHAALCRGAVLARDAQQDCCSGRARLSAHRGRVSTFPALAGRTVPTCTTRNDTRRSSERPRPPHANSA